MEAEMAHELDEVSRLLGDMQGSLRELARRFDRHETRAEERDEVLGKMQDEALGMAADVRYLKEVLVADVKPVTDDVKRWRTMGLGALGIIGVGGAAVGSAFLYLLNQLGWIKLP